MGWLLVLLSLTVLWIASLCKIRHKSSLSSNTFLLSDGGGIAKKNVLLVVAHPDDESMFFSPTINYLISRGHNLHLLCLSIGNADGMGNIRKQELYKACAVLKVPLKRVMVLDHPDLQDGFDQVWDRNVLVIVITAMCIMGKFVRENSQRIEAWELVSTNVLRKYCGPVDIWLSMLSASKSSNKVMPCLVNEDPLKSFRAMAEHSSQWVWFRKLFVSFSSYTYINTLKKIDM